MDKLDEKTMKKQQSEIKSLFDTHITYDGELVLDHWRGNPVGLRHLCNVTGAYAIKSLSLANTAIHDDEMTLIEGLHGIQKLNLSHTDIADDGVRHLQVLYRLNSLNLAYTNITDESISYFGILSLSALDLAGTMITDNGVKRMCRMKQISTSLVSLNLDHTEITDDCILPLVDAMKNLRSIEVWRTKIMPKTIEKILCALPLCKVKYFPFYK